MGFGNFIKKAAKVAVAPVKATHGIVKKAIAPLPGGKKIGGWGDKVIKASGGGSGRKPLEILGARPAARPAPMAAAGNIERAIGRGVVKGAV